ncbi:hypothetical protein ABW20_dc0102699 [Dactylellina cionopaga]|nr:hypothetical protein ABW20_dc0102699 [Dactylellina cionopaga]
MSFGFSGMPPMGSAPGPPPPIPFVNQTAPGYTPNVEFQLNPVDPGIGAANRDKIMAEQQRILTIFNDWFMAQKLKLMGRVSARLPQLANEQSNRDQLQNMVKDMAEMNVNRMQMTGIINNFGQQYCKFVGDLNAVESQRQLNEIERARQQGYLFLPLAHQRFVRTCQVTVVFAVGGTFGALIAIWSGATAIKTSMQAAKTAGLQCLIMGLIQFLCIVARNATRYPTWKIPLHPQIYGRDKIFVTRLWDIYIILLLGGIISFGAWMWTKSNAIFMADAAAGGENQVVAQNLAPMMVANAMQGYYTTTLMAPVMRETENARTLLTITRG